MRHSKSINDENQDVACRSCTGGRLTLCAVITMVFGLTLVGFATFFPMYIQGMLNTGIQNAVVLNAQSQSDFTDSWRNWQNTADPNAPPAYYYVYAWNLTNSEDVLAKGAKPNLVQVGPYVYRYAQNRFNVTWQTFQNRRSMKYREWQYWVFSRDLTPANLAETDVVTTVNVVFQGVLATFGPVLVSQTMQIYSTIYPKNTQWNALFTRRPVSEVFWGYEDPVLAYLHKAMPTKVTSSFFAGLLGNTTSQDEAYLSTSFNQIYTGEDDMATLRGYIKFQNNEFVMCGEPAQPAWLTTDANRIFGTDGTQFAPNVQSGSTVSVWVDTLNREADLTNLNNETNVLKGITTLRFRISDRVLANSTLNPMNWAYWMNGPSGVINITNCAPNNVPIFLSLPHFYRASPSVPALVTGMQPDPTLHDLWLDVEPNTGATMSAHKRLQINVHLKPIHPFLDPSKAWFNNVNASLLCPSLWLDVQGQISDDLASKFKSSVYMGQSMKYYSLWVGFFLGYTLVFVACALFLWSTQRRVYEVRKEGASGHTQPLLA